MNICQARKTDIDSVERIYERIHDEMKHGLNTTGWVRGVYPTRKSKF